MAAIKRLFDILHFQQANYPQEKAFNHKVNNTWTSVNTGEAINIINRVSSGLLEYGVTQGDKVALVSYRNRMEWIFMDMALQQIGAVSVPVYPTISSREYSYIFNEAEVSLAFVGGGDLYDKVEETQSQVPNLKEIFTFDEVEGRRYWRELWSDDRLEEVEQLKSQVAEDDLATIIYTSGTTGAPKGVMLSHKNIVSNAFAAKELVRLDPGDRVLSFLPLCHIFERTSGYFQIYQGANIYYTGTDQLGGDDGDLKAVKPHFFDTVPRVLEKVYEKIYAKGLELKGLKRRIFFWALSLTDDFEYGKEYSGWEKIKRKIADRLVFSKWREALGGEVKIIVSGAAPLPEKITRVFNAAGIMLGEAYGMTEASPGVAGGRPQENRALVGSAGPAFPGVEIQIDEDNQDYGPGEGEIMVSGPNVMQGYYKKPAETAAVLHDEAGKRWLRTGDIGKLIPGPGGETYLKITDRKKELLKTSGGKYVAPAPIESRFKEEFLVEQIMVVGEQRKFVSALIVPSDEVLKNWCEEQGLTWTNMKEMIQLPKVIQAFDDIVAKVNQEFSKIEQVKKFVLVDQEWLANRPDGTEAELTPTMKLKRRVISRKYKDLIENMYA